MSYDSIQKFCVAKPTPAESPSFFWVPDGYAAIWNFPCWLNRTDYSDCQEHEKITDPCCKVKSVSF